jgi:hypothetical protein
MKGETHEGDNKLQYNEDRELIRGENGIYTLFTDSVVKKFSMFNVKFSDLLNSNIRKFIFYTLFEGIMYFFLLLCCKYEYSKLTLLEQFRLLESLPSSRLHFVFIIVHSSFISLHLLLWLL